jgi:hypothetical protein
MGGKDSCYALSSSWLPPLSPIRISNNTGCSKSLCALDDYNTGSYK